jgi:hypothetical protein
MAKRHTRKMRKSLRRRGAGYSTGPESINPGNLEYVKYAGIGKDCTGNPDSIRTGYISHYEAKGLPGLSGGRYRKRVLRKKGGGTYPVPNPHIGPVAGSLTPKPGYFPDTTGVGGTVASPATTMSMPGVPTMANMANMAKPQAGGRYGFFPGMGPLNPSNGVGVTPAPFGRIACESGTVNPLNPNTNGIQTMTTAPLNPRVMNGGAMFPLVNVGAVDSMRYEAPTAGYTNNFMTFRAPSPVPGLTVQIPYNAREFNPACIKTGGSRRYRKTRSLRKGGSAVAQNAGTFTPITMSEVGSRFDFDGTRGGLPVKFGGKRRSRRVSRKSRKSRKSHK